MRTRIDTMFVVLCAFLAAVGPVEAVVWTIANPQPAPAHYSPTANISCGGMCSGANDTCTIQFLDKDSEVLQTATGTSNAQATSWSGTLPLVVVAGETVPWPESRSTDFGLHDRVKIVPNVGTVMGSNPVEIQVY